MGAPTIVPFTLLFVSFLLGCTLLDACELNSSSKHPNHHKWVGPTGQRTIVVDAKGSGDFLSVQEAVDSIPVNNTERILLKINAGCYIEKVVVPATKPYITFQGEGKDATVIEWHDRASDRGPNGQQLRTYNTASVTVFASYFSAKNISFKVSQCLHDQLLIRPRPAGARIACNSSDTIECSHTTFFRCKK